jgi:hypothetical protein
VKIKEPRYYNTVSSGCSKHIFAETLPSTRRRAGAPAPSDLKWIRPLLKYEIIGHIIIPDFEEE